MVDHRVFGVHREMGKTLLLAMLALCVSLARAGTPAGADGKSGEPETALGQRVESFTLRDFRGKSHSLSDFEDRRAIVIAFLGTECPLAVQYAPRLVQLSDRFAEQGVAFIGINSNQ